MSQNKIAEQLNVRQRPLAGSFSAIQVNRAIILSKLKQQSTHTN